MSLHLEFEPHSWYMGFAIQDPPPTIGGGYNGVWRAYIDNSFYVDELCATTLRDLKRQIRGYHLIRHNGYGERIARRRLEYLRGELRAGRMSYNESNELAELANYIKPGDVELAEAAGIPEEEFAKR